MSARLERQYEEGFTPLLLYFIVTMKDFLRLLGIYIIVSISIRLYITVYEVQAIEAYLAFILAILIVMYYKE